VSERRKCDRCGKVVKPGETKRIALSVYYPKNVGGVSVAETMELCNPCHASVTAFAKHHPGDEGAATPAVLAIVLAIAGVFAGLSLVVSKTFATWCIGTVIVLCALGFFCEAMSRLTGEREHSRSRRARHRPSTNSAGAAGNAVGTISPRPRTPVRSGAPIACINAPLCALPNGHRGQCTKAREAHVEVVCRSTANEVTPTTREDMLHGVDAMFRRLHAPPGPYDWAVDVSEAEWAERFWRMVGPS
jgi:hypothetical protein